MIDSWFSINKETEMVDDIMNRCLEKLTWAIHGLDGRGPHSSQLEGSSESSGSARSSFPIRSRRGSRMNL